MEVFVARVYVAGGVLEEGFAVQVRPGRSVERAKR
jgi:hypothetical protein